ncbi:hypothetical protein BKA62DRAFT_688987 [Auriculariales sp. MPI-PUGE-AT-0066]|nr:hypothetical protein BKA62DRAFT_688987 [Auriculariales sp. MPI-PUGE-AT-0066]
MSNPSPLAEFPAELLGKVFLHLLDWPAGKVFDDIYVIKQGFKVASVNRHFRSVAVDIPRLWSVIDFDCQHLKKDAARAERWTSYLNLVLQRSSQAPLHISLMYFDCSCGMQHDIFDKLTAQSHRWASFYITYTKISTPMLLRLFQVQVPKLQLATILSHDDQSRSIAGNRSNLTPLFSNALKLTDLTIAMNIFEYCDFPRAIGQRLERLTLRIFQDRVGDTHLFDIIQRCAAPSSLRELTLSKLPAGGRSYQYHGSSDNGIITLDRLEKLELEDTVLIQIEPSLGRLQVPALRQANIAGFSATKLEHREILRSLCGTVKKLVLSCDSIMQTEDESGSILSGIICQWCPELRELDLRSCLIKLSDIEVLNSPTNQSHGLHSLRLPFCRFATQDRADLIEGFKSFVESRINVGGDGSTRLANLAMPGFDLKPSERAGIDELINKVNRAA